VVPVAVVDRARPGGAVNERTAASKGQHRTTPTSRYMRVSLLVLAGFELLTLGILLINLWTAHLRIITQVVGPTHGLVYVLVIVLALVTPGLRLRDRLLGLVPVLGGPLAVISARAGSRRATPRS
jgi:hypothetical protein